MTDPNEETANQHALYEEIVDHINGDYEAGLQSQGEDEGLESHLGKYQSVKNFGIFYPFGIMKKEKIGMDEAPKKFPYDIYHHLKDVHTNVPPTNELLGMERVKAHLTSTIQFPIEYPDLYSEMCPARMGLCIYGPRGSGKRTVVTSFCREVGANLFVVKEFYGEPFMMAKLLEFALSVRPCVIHFDNTDRMFESQEGKLQKDMARWDYELMFLLKQKEALPRYLGKVWLVFGYGQAIQTMDKDCFAELVEGNAVYAHPPDNEDIAMFISRLQRKIWGPTMWGDPDLTEDEDERNLIYARINILTDWVPNFIEKTTYGEIASFIKSIYARQRDHLIQEFQNSRNRTDRVVDPGASQRDLVAALTPNSGDPRMRPSLDLLVYISTELRNSPHRCIIKLNARHRHSEFLPQ